MLPEPRAKQVAASAKALFDNTSATAVTFDSATPTVTYALSGAGQRATFYTITNGASGGAPSAWRLEGSKNGKDWTVLDRRSGLSNAQLARRALVSPQSMNEVLLALEQRGLVRRRAHPDHGRILQARLTAKGRALLARCDAEVHEVEARMVGGLSEHEQATLRGALLSSIRALHGGLQR